MRGQPLPPKEAAELCAKIAEALHHAHEQGVIHRDLKPGNIMMSLDGQPHIMDFGLFGMLQVATLLSASMDTVARSDVSRSAVIESGMPSLSRSLQR